MNVAVIGTGYVGLVVGACLAETGNSVICADVDDAKIQKLKANRIPIHEPGLGPLVIANQAAGHILTHTLHYGLGVFEGLRCYRTADDRSAVFRLSDHIRRLFDSARINLIEIPFTPKEIEEASLETLRRNHLAEGYIRPLVFIGDGGMGLNPGANAIRVAVIAWAWGKYLGEEGMANGIRAKVSTFNRHHENSKMTKGKTCGDYVNSILAKREALLDGYAASIAW